MTDSLDNILSGGSAAAPEAETNEVVTQEAQIAEGESQQQEPEAEGEEAQQGQRMVPHEALHAEKQKVKRYTEQVASFEQTLKERDSAWERRLGQILEAVKPKQEQQQEQAPDWYADPDAAFTQKLGGALNPLASTVSQIQTQLIRLTAVQTHGADKVQAFETYVADALAKGDPEMGTLSAQMRASQDPMKVGLDWFEKRTFDPTAERERIRAELLKEINPEGQQEEQRAAPVMPSNFASVRNAGARGGPAWGGPPSLETIFDTSRPK